MWNGENLSKSFHIFSIRSEVLFFVKFRVFDISEKWYELEHLANDYIKVSLIGEFLFYPYTMIIK